MRLLPRGGAFQERDFVRLWGAQASSAIGARVTRTALPVMAVLISGSPFAVGLLVALALGPAVLVSLATGGLIERSRKRPILIAADLARGAAVFSLPVAAWAGVLTMAQLYAVASLVGIGTAVFQIADRAYLPTLLDRDLLVAGNSTLEATEAVAEIAGPGLAGVLIQALTAPVAVLVDALGYLASASLLHRIRKVEAPPLVEASPSVWRDIKLGFGASWSHPLVRPVFLAVAASTFFTGTFASLYYIYLLDHLGLSLRTFGIVVAMGGIGSLVGAIGSAPITRRLGLGRAMFLLLLFHESASLLTPAASGPDWLVLVFLFGHQLIGDAFAVAFMVQEVSLRQRVLPLEVLSRSNAAFQAMSGALLPLGALASGALAEVIGVRATLWIGMGSAALTTPLFLLPLWRVKDVPAGPAVTSPGSPALPAGPPGSSA